MCVGGGEWVELHAAGVRGLSWRLEWNEKKAVWYQHLTHIRTIEMRCGSTVTFIRAQQRVSVWKERIPLLREQPTKPFEWQSNHSQLMLVCTCGCAHVYGKELEEEVGMWFEQMMNIMRVCSSSEGIEFLPIHPCQA